MSMVLVGGPKKKNMFPAGIKKLFASKTAWMLKTSNGSLEKEDEKISEVFPSNCQSATIFQSQRLRDRYHFPAILIDFKWQ